MPVSISLAQALASWLPSVSPPYNLIPPSLIISSARYAAVAAFLAQLAHRLSWAAVAVTIQKREEGPTATVVSGDDDVDEQAGREEEPDIKNPAAMQVRAERRRRLRPGVAAAVLLGVRWARAGALRGARRVRQPPAVPAPPRRRRARVRLRGAGPARAARLRRRRVPRRAVADGARRGRRWRRRPAVRRRRLVADMRLAQRQQGPRGGVSDA